MRNLILLRVLSLLFLGVSLTGCQLSDRFFGSASTSERKPGAASDAVAAQFDFRYATNASRSGSLPLDGATLDKSGEYYLFLESTDHNAGTIQFYINDAVVNSDNSYPYDVNGGTARAAVAQDMSLFVPGRNTLSAKVKGKVVADIAITVDDTSVITDPAPTPTYGLSFATSADRSGAQALDGSTLTADGSYYVFLETDDPNAGTVTFSVNGTQVRSDSSAPFDMQGGTLDLATAQDLSVFVDGSNRVTVQVDGTLVAEATVTLEPAPAPAPTYGLSYSTSADRSGALGLDGATFAADGAYYIFLQTNDTAARTVTFTVNGTQVRSDSTAPYDMQDGTLDLATVQDLSVFVEGGNQIGVQVDGVTVAEATVTLEPVTPPPATISLSLYWSAPVERENGDPLSLSEIGGYEIRYREAGTQDYTVVTVNDGSADQYFIDGLPDATYEVEIAAFDQDGLYSSFVQLTN